jgi:prepilin-type N-terminal cleavage/methylation domain-containing protein
MHLKQKKNKGFTLLEVIVVVVLIGIISAAGYPEFNKWKKDREARLATEEIAGLIVNASNLGQRGEYPYTQLHFNAVGSNVTVTLKGMTQDSLSNKQNTGAQPNCSMNAVPSYWDKNIAIKSFTKISLHFTGGPGAICFSKDASFYKTMGRIGANDKTMFICYIQTRNACPINGGNGQEPVYLVEWSRFGNVVKKKWNGSAWITR